MTQVKGRHIIVDFEDIIVDEITLLPRKANKYGGAYIGLRYSGKELLVKYKPRTSPFGVTANKEDVSRGNERGKYKGDLKVTGYSTHIITDEDDFYLAKAKELDQFFIDKCIENSVDWYLGGTKDVPVAKEVISGYDDNGLRGKWKRMVKYSSTTNKATGETTYNDYPPRLEFKIDTNSAIEVEGSGGDIHQESNFETKFFTANGTRVPDVSSITVGELLRPFSEIAVLASWNYIYVGLHGASMKPKAKQIRVIPQEGFDMDDCQVMC